MTKILFRETFGDYKAAYGLNGFIVTVDECNYVQRNGLNNFLPNFLTASVCRTLDIIPNDTNKNLCPKFCVGDCVGEH